MGFAWVWVRLQPERLLPRRASPALFKTKVCVCCRELTFACPSKWMEMISDSDHGGDLEGWKAKICHVIIFVSGTFFLVPQETVYLSKVTRNGNETSCPLLLLFYQTFLFFLCALAFIFSCIAYICG